MNVNSKIVSAGLALLIVTSMLPSGLVGTADAQQQPSPNSYSVIQGTNCWEVTPYQPGDPNPDGPGGVQPHVEIVTGSNELGPSRNESWDGSPTIESVMDYRYRDPAGGVHDNAQPWGQRPRYAPWLNELYWKEGWQYGTYGLWNWSTNQESLMFFYNGPEGDSVVFRHDKLYDSTGTGSHGPYNGMHHSATSDGFMSPQPGKSAATFIFRDLPAGEWAYMDDLYPEDMDAIYYASDEFNYDDESHTRYGTYHNDYGAAPLSTYGGGTDFTAHWTWGDSGTDGGAYRGLQNLAAGESLVIEPYFDEESYFWSNYWWQYNRSEGDGITDWVIRRKGAENIRLDKSQSVEIRRGSHCPNANFQVGTAANSASVEVGEQYNLDASASEGSGIEYNWDVDGDGQFEVRNGTDSFLTRTYDGNVTGDVSVTLMVEDSGGLQNTAERQIRVEPAEPPDVNVTVGGTNENSFDNYHVANETLTFDATGTTDNGVLNVSSAVWRVDGNVTARGQLQYAQTFSETGEHQVSFRVSDEAGHNNTRTMTVDVVGLDTENPTANAEVTPQAVEAGANVTFDGSASDDNRDIAEYRWDTNGDGTVDSGEETLVNSYPAPDTHNVTLEVEDANGNVDNATVAIEVMERQPPNITDVSVPDRVTTGEEFTLAATASDNGRIAAYQWVIDGEVVQTGEQATYTFTEDISESRGHAFQLIVTDAAGEQNATESRTISVLPRDETPPDARLSVSTNETKVGNSVTFNASNSTDEPHRDIETYHWNFDGVNSTDRTTDEPVVTHEYNSAGTYNATVIVEDESGNNGTAPTAQIRVEENEQAQRDSSSSSSVSVSTGPPPVNTDTEQTGANSVAIDVRNARSDETIRADLPESDVASETGVRFGSVAVDIRSDDPHVIFETAASEEPPEGTAELTATDETLAYLDLDVQYLDRGVRNATVEFTVQQSEIGQSGDPSDIAVYQYDGSWSQVNATVEGTTDDAYRLSVTTDELGALAVGANQPLSVADVELASDTVTTGESLNATATVENTGTTARSLTMDFTLDGNVLASETVEVPPGETADVTLTGTAPTTGTYEATVGGVVAGTLTVQEVQPADVSVTGVSLNESSIDAGEQVAITATVENTGGEQGEQMVTLTLFGEQLANETVQVPPGETREVTFVRQIDAAGTYTVDVNGETTELDVAESGLGNDLGDAAPDVPGFGLGATLAALLAAALLARLRH